MLLYISFLLYFVVLLGIAYIGHKRTRHWSDFFVARRKLGLVVTTASLSATGIGGSATIVAAAYVYKYGLPGIWFNLAAALFLALLGWLVAPKVRRLATYSLPELVGRFYGLSSRRIAALLILLAEIAWLSLTLQASRLVFVGLGLEGNQDWLLIAIALVFILYTLWGGQFAISYSDLFQIAFILVSFLAVALPILFWHGGSALPGLDAELLRFPTNEHMPWPKALSLLFVIGFPHLVGSDIYAKILSSRDEGTARKASFWAAGIRLLWGVGLALFALLAMANIPQVQDLGKSAMLLPLSFTAFFSPFFAGLFLAALLAILMSSADTILMTAGTVATLDLLPENMSDKQKMLSGRLAIALIGLAGLFLALKAPGIIDTLELAYTLFAAGLSLPVLAGLFGLPIPPKGALLAMAGGGLSALALQLELISVLPGEPIFWGLGVSLLLLAAAYTLAPKKLSATAQKKP